MNIPPNAIDAAKEAMQSVTPPPGVSKANWLSAYGDFALIAGAIAAAAPHISAQALEDAVHAFPLETIHAPDNAVVWMMRRAEQLRSKR